MKTISLSDDAILYLRTLLETAEGYDSVIEALCEAFPEANDESEDAMERMGNASSELHAAIGAIE